MKLFFKKLFKSILLFGMYMVVFWIFGYFILTIFSVTDESAGYMIYVSVITILPLLLMLFLIVVSRYKKQAGKEAYLTKMQEAEHWGIGKELKSIFKSGGFWMDGIICGLLCVPINVIHLIAQEKTMPFGFQIFFFVIIFIITQIINLALWLIVHKLWRNERRQVQPVPADSGVWADTDPAE